MTTKEKAAAYDAAIKKVKELAIDDYLDAIAVTDIFPELNESEDERIRKEILEYFTKYGNFELRGIDISHWIAWLEKQDMKRRQLYVRFGDIPSNEKSKIYCGEEEIGEENGVSVYPAFELNGNIVLGLTLPITRTTLYTQQNLLEYDNRPCYVVTGDYVGKGTDGEPLIRNISIIKRLYSYRIKEFEKQCKNNMGISEATKQKLEDNLNKALEKETPETWNKFLEKQGEKKSIESTKTKLNESMIKPDPNPYWTLAPEYKLMNEQKSALSEEDDQYLLVCKNALAKYQTTDKWDASVIYRWLVNKVKSLRPQKQWKPSEEQMNTLKQWLKDNQYKGDARYCYPIFESLYQDLKKLREE